jgi:hypothetical protein
MELASGETVVIAPHPKMGFRRVETYRWTPWFIGAHRLGELLFRPVPRGSGVLIHHIVARETFVR